ncbi:MAG: type II toxin-antitoxin system RatA family toxin [Pseudomonadota bacterium]|nr:type II toxin-antitoxin system RatA family toxin [Pseudomonadota bacterium]
MVNISQSALLPYSAEQMFALVNDIPAYPHFMHGCLGAEVLSVHDNTVTARLDLGKAGLRYSLTTHNELFPPVKMKMTLVDGPFSSFSAEWQFVPLRDDACKTSLDMRFEFGAGLLNVALKALFEATSRDLVKAITKRAEHLYGKK